MSNKEKPYFVISETRADDTLREFKQILRIEVDYRDKDNPHICFTFDRVHKANPKQSAPIGFLHFTLYEQLYPIAKGTLTAMIFTALRSRMKKSWITNYDIRDALNSILKILVSDVEEETKSLFRMLKIKGLANYKEW